MREVAKNKRQNNNKNRVYFLVYTCISLLKAYHHFKFPHNVFSPTLTQEPFRCYQRKASSARSQESFFTEWGQWRSR